MIRILLLAVLVAAAATWAVLRHYSKEPPPLFPGHAPPAPTYDEDAGELPVPEMTERDAG